MKHSPGELAGELQRHSHFPPTHSRQISPLSALTPPNRDKDEHVDITYTEDQDEAETSYNIEATRLLLLSIPTPPSAGLSPILGAKLTPGVDVRGCKLLHDELIMFYSPKEVEYLVSLDFCEKLGNGVLDVSRLPGEWKGPMELKIEFFSITAWDPCEGFVGGAKSAMAQGEGIIRGDAREEDTFEAI